MKYIKKFDTHAEYEAALSSLILPNVSFCVDTPNEVHYNPYVPETRVVAKFNVTDTSNPTKICYRTSGFSAIEIDGVAQPSVVSAYTFNTTGEHTVKYTLADPTCIGGSAFFDCRSLTSVTIPNSVTTISNGAFDYCMGMTSCTIGNGVTSIGNQAFRLCSSLTSVTIPDSVTTIGSSAFSWCTFTSVTIPSGVTSIGDTTFAYCSGLTSVTIPSGVTSIGNYAFQGCTSLTSITSNATTAPTVQSGTFLNASIGGTLYVPSGSTGYDSWLFKLSDWTKVEQ